MTADDFDRALDRAVRETGVERYRFLCSEANTLGGANSREEWRRFIAERRWVPSASPVAVSYGTPTPTPGGCCP
jgi:hypothetical protein